MKLNNQKGKKKTDLIQQQQQQSGTQNIYWIMIPCIEILAKVDENE